MSSEIPILCRVQALYPFKSNDPSSLCFHQDDYIDVLNKLPSGWWDGLCNDTRGWFPSNYVKEIDDEEEVTEQEFVSNSKRKNEYRLSLAYNSSDSNTHSNDSLSQQNNWIVQRTEDGTGFYYYNPITGEMRFNHEETDEDETPMPFPTTAIPNRTTLLNIIYNQHESEEIDEQDELDLEHHLTTSSIVLLDSESESDYKSTVDISWSDGASTLHSIEEKPQPQPPQLLPRSPSRRPIKNNQAPPLSWNTLSSQIGIAIHQFTTAAKNGHFHLYYPCSITIVNSIRFMLISSCTIDKDAGYIKSHGTLRSHHRAMMASMSKLTLSAQTYHMQDERTVNKIMMESSDLSLMVRNFINTCQDLNIPLVHSDPQWIQDVAHPQRPQPQRYSLQINLAENLETMGTCIQDSAETIMKCITSSNTSRDPVSLAALLFTHFRNLSNQTGLFLAYLDETDFSSVVVDDGGQWTDLLLGKQALADGLGLLFFKMQALTNEHMVDFDTCLKETEQAAGSLYQPIDLICASVLHLASRHASHKLKDDDDSTNDQDHRRPIDRHQSEIVVTPSSPSPMQRSHTAPPSKQSSSNKLKKFFGDDTPLPAVATATKAVVVTKSTAVVNERPEFLQYDYGPNDIVFNMEGSVRGGTLPALVERLTMHDYLDMNFINTFLLTYRSFCSSQQLLDLLEARYNLHCPDGLTSQEATLWEEKKLKLVRLRVFNVLKNWLELYYNEDDSILLDRLLEFTHTHIKSTLKFSNGQLESLIQTRRDPTDDGSGLKKMILTLPDPPEPILPKNKRRFKLLDIDTLEMARQLTIMDFKLYSAIKPIECLDKAWSSQEDDDTGNIRSSIEYCNQVTSWVSDVILSQHDIKKRSIFIKYWVQVAEKCRILNNFNTCMAILSAFDNSSVGRLKRTWEVVGARTNQVLQQIRKLMGANRNFTEYREMIHSINPPCIPFLGIYLQDLTFIEDGNANELKKNKALINFAKRAKTAEVIREIQQYQSSLYQLKPVDDLQDFIKTNLKSTRDEEQLYKESLKLEPRERDDEKITRLLQESGFL